MVREKKNSSRSGKCQGILFCVRENWHFEEKSGKIEIISQTDFTSLFRTVLRNWLANWVLGYELANYKLRITQSNCELRNIVLNFSTNEHHMEQ